MTQTFNYIAAILVVFFGLWLFSGNNRHYPASATANDVAEATNEIQAVIEPHYRDSLNGEMHMDSSDNQDVAYSSAQSAGSNFQPASETIQLAAGTARTGVVNQHQPADAYQTTGAVDNSADDPVSDADWYSGLMNKARSIGDRIINIDITGNSSQSVASVAGENTGDELNDENSLLPQPTESESLAENKVDCPSMMYMGGNAYGRNMLIRMGCPVP